MKIEEFPLVSIALCTYNGARFLRPQLDTLVNQTYPNLEIVAVDDGSEDDTMIILQEYAEKHLILSINRNTQNLGYQKNFEKALQLCHGKYVAISDQDDLWELNKIQIMVENLKENVLVYHDSNFIDEHGHDLGMKMSDRINMIKGRNPLPFIFFNCISGHSMLIRKSLLELALPFPQSGFYDQWLAFVASHFGNIEYIPHCLVKYRQHEMTCTDITGKRPTPKGLTRSRNRMQTENEWLRVCANFQRNKIGPSYAASLYKKAENRTENYFNLSYGMEIWKNRAGLLEIIRKNEWSKFCFSVRHIWGLKTKALFKF